MMTVSFSVWELAVLIIAIAFVIGTIYLVKVFKNLSATLDSSAKMIDESRLPISRILENMDGISENTSEMTGRVNGMVGDAEDSMTKVKSEIVDPLISVFAKIAKVMKAVSRSEKKKKTK